MEFSADPFKASEVSQSCWSMCHNGVAIPPELLPSLLPIYRDDETRAAYEDVANFFYCMDACDEQYLVKRITFILPFVAGGIKQRVSKLSTFDLESEFGLFCRSVHYWKSPLQRFLVRQLLLPLQKGLQ